jgi:hypothetical protein
MYHFLLLGILFFVLTPGVFVTLPPKCSKLVVAATHAAIFVVVFYVLRMYIREGFQDKYRKPEMPQYTKPPESVSMK